MGNASVIVPFERALTRADLDWLHTLAAAPQVAQLVIASPAEPPGGLSSSKLTYLRLDGPRGGQLRASIPEAKGSQVILQAPDRGYSVRDYGDLLAPLVRGDAEAVYGNRFGSARSVGSYVGALADRGLKMLTSAITNLDLSDPDCGLKAFDGRVLRGLHLNSDGAGIDAEITFKIAAQFYRVYEVPLRHSVPPRRDSIARKLSEARTLVRYASSMNDSDNLHEGYNTLLRMDGAPRYNAWLGRKLRAQLGQRVLEVGAGIGTITRQIEQGRDLVIALEIDPFYVEKLKNLFARRPNVMPYLSGVEDADWERLRPYCIDSILLSNVLEHISDDARAVENFRRLLPPGGRLVILVPALPGLFGTIDQAVGHHRRYTPRSLRALLERGGFTVEHLEWLNLLGIPGWFVNGRILKRRAVPALQLALYDRLAPLLSSFEDRVPLPVGMSLLAVARGGDPK